MKNKERKKEFRGKEGKKKGKKEKRKIKKEGLLLALNWSG